MSSILVPPAVFSRLESKAEFQKRWQTALPKIQLTSLKVQLRSLRRAGEPLIRFRPGGLTCKTFRPLNRVHALGLLAIAIEATRLLQRVLRSGEFLGSRSTDTFRLLCGGGTSSGLALHVLRRRSTALRGLAHSSGRGMLFASRIARSR